MQPELITAVVGVVVSLGFEFIPGLTDWYNALQDKYQKLVMVGVGAGVVGVAYGLSCLQWFGVGAYTCDWIGGQKAIMSFVAFLLANQSTYALFLKKGNEPAEG